MIEEENVGNGDNGEGIQARGRVREGKGRKVMELEGRDNQNEETREGTQKDGRSLSIKRKEVG